MTYVSYWRGEVSAPHSLNNSGFMGPEGQKK